jgi:hypothetical protein
MRQVLLVPLGDEEDTVREEEERKSASDGQGKSIY